MSSARGDFLRQLKALTIILQGLQTLPGTNLRCMHLASLSHSFILRTRTRPDMLTPEFLRRQAENCLRIARTCFDLASAERLRLMASELNAKAAEIEDSGETGSGARLHRIARARLPYRATSRRPPNRTCLRP